MCGDTIYCAPLDVECTAAPVCGEGTVEVESCEEDDTTCEAHTICGSTIFCAEDELELCQAYPSCPPDEVEVESCEEDDESCHAESLCGDTILCAAAEAE